MTSSEIAKYLYKKLIAAGVTIEGACAILGNVQAESGFIPNNLEDTANRSLGMTDTQYTQAVDNGTYTNFVHDGCGYGLPQWTFWTRKDGFLKYMRSLGKSIADLDGQIGYLIKEMQESFSSIWKQLITSKDLYALTWVLLDKWENPAVKNIGARYQYAQNWFKALISETQTGSDKKLTEEQAINKVLNLARSEIGYREKISNSQLDDKTANAGSGNWTKYARDLDAVTNFYNGAKNGFAWCDIYVDWLFYHSFGAATAMNMLCQPQRSAGAGCLYSAQYYKNAGRWTNRPAPGEQIFFTYAPGEVSHTGIVEQVNGNQVVTIEGNSGDQVARRVYSITDSHIYGYGIPRWSYATGSPAQSSYTPATPVNDGILRYRSTGNAVKTLQQNLIRLGYNCGASGADGDFGNGTLNAVKQFQSNNGLVADGEVGPLTLNMINTKLQKLNASSSAIPTNNKTYTVQRGDSLWKIAAEQLGAGYRYSEIKKLNGLTSDVIKPGQVLKLP